MKTDVRRSIVQLEPDVFNDLVNEVKETLATDLGLSPVKQPLFTAADLWKIRRNARTAQGRLSR